MAGKIPAFDAKLAAALIAGTLALSACGVSQKVEDEQLIRELEEELDAEELEAVDAQRTATEPKKKSGN